MRQWLFFLLVFNSMERNSTGEILGIGKPPTLINQPLVDSPCPYNLGMMEGLVNDHVY